MYYCARNCGVVCRRDACMRRRSAAQSWHIQVHACVAFFHVQFCDFYSDIVKYCDMDEETRDFLRDSRIEEYVNIVNVRDFHK